MSPLRVLHVDDEPDIRDVVETALELVDSTLTVHGCGSAVDGLKAAAEETPDIILLDIMMPGMDGPTMLSHLRESPETASIPVVILTARAEKSSVERFRSLGVAGVITKPFDPFTLAAEVLRCSQVTDTAPSRISFARRAQKDAPAVATCEQPLAVRRDLPGTHADTRTAGHGASGQVQRALEALLALAASLAGRPRVR